MWARWRRRQSGLSAAALCQRRPAAARSAGAPGTYESGGPTDNVLSIWKVAAPALDILAPDIYVEDSAEYLKVMELYHRDDNALFISGDRSQRRRRPLLVSALGMGAIAFSPFGLDYVEGGTKSSSRRSHRITN